MGRNYVTKWIPYITLMYGRKSMSKTTCTNGDEKFEVVQRYQLQKSTQLSFTYFLVAGMHWNVIVACRHYHHILKTIPAFVLVRRCSPKSCVLFLKSRNKKAGWWKWTCTTSGHRPMWNLLPLRLFQRYLRGSVATKSIVLCLVSDVGSAIEGL